MSRLRQPLILTTAILTVAGACWLFLGHRPTPLAQSPPPHDSTWSALATPPDWSTLEPFQETITRDHFEHLLTTVFTSGHGWQKWIEIDDHEARIRTGGADDQTMFHLRFAPHGTQTSVPTSWHPAATLPPAPANQPLAGLHIAIDPGHIGGNWAQIEERWLQPSHGPAIREGNMTLLVAQLLKPKLETLGARVSLVRLSTEPLTPLRPQSLLELARKSSPPDTPAAQLQKTAERLFYRTAEIRARAQLVNDFLKPDLVLCLHFNADSWGNANQPTLTNRSHLHLLINGAYTDDEISLADQRYAMLLRLLSGTHDEETSVATTVATTFSQSSGLPPFIYQNESPGVIPIDGNPYLWARNLLANRLYQCPVIFMEPYVMNSTIDLPRMQAGDYDGNREINGSSQSSIFRDYANALADGLARHYATTRRKQP